MTNYELFLSVFNGRRDIIPKHYDFIGRDNDRVSGYSPLCALSGKQSCPKKQGKVSSCHYCASPEYVHMSEKLLNQHFDGKIILGIYPMLDDGISCYWIAGDFDNHDGSRNPKDDVRDLIEVCECQDIPAYTLKSKSGAGYHVYLFFDKPILASKARRVFGALLEEAGLKDDNSFDRMFPNQDSTAERGKGFGNLIALPFQNINKKLVNTGFLMPDFETLELDQWDYISKIKKVSESQLDVLIDEWKIDLSEQQSPRQKSSQKEKINPISILSGIPEGERDEKLFRYACRLRSQGLSQTEIEIIICHAADNCTPPFQHDKALAKVESALRYDYSDVSIPDNDSWLQDALLPQKGEDRKRIAMMLCSYWTHHFDNDKEQVRLSLFGWNIQNQPPLEQSDLESIIERSQDRQGYDNFSRVTGINLSHAEKVRFPDGRREYNFYILGISEPASFQAAQLISKPTFQAKFLDLTGRIPMILSGKGSVSEWRQIINDVLDAAPVIEMPEEMTVMERLRQIIKKGIDNFTISDSHDWHDEIDRDIIIYNNNILFKGNVIMLKCKFEASEELKHLSRQEINGLLTKMGFELPVKATSINGKNFKVFKMPSILFESNRDSL